MILLFNQQVKVGTVTQHDSLFFHLFQQAENPKRQIQNQAHPGLYWARSKVHGHRLNNIHLRENRIKEAIKNVKLRAGNDSKRRTSNLLNWNVAGHIQSFIVAQLCSVIIKVIMSQFYVFVIDNNAL